MDPVQNNQNNSNQNPNIDTSVSDGSAMPFPIGGEVGAAPTPPTTSGSAAPAEAPVADATGANQPALNQTPPPPPASGSVVAIKPTRGKIGPTGIIATIFGVLLLVGATLGGVLLVQQNQEIREKAGTDSCDWCAGTDQCPNPASDSSRAQAVCGGLNCCQGWHQATSGGGTQPPPSCTGISCNGGQCVDGTIFAPDSCAPQATCEQRANDACAGHGGVAITDIQNPSPSSNPASSPVSSAYGSACTGSCCTLQTSTIPACASNCWVVKYKCPGADAGIPCNLNGVTTGFGSTQCMDSNYCGSQQVDVRCTNYDTSQPDCAGRQSGDAISAITNKNPGACTITSPIPIATETPSSPPGGNTLSASCLNIKAYDTSWNQLTAADLANLQVGDIVRFAVKGSATSGTFNKARFTINNILRPEVTTTNPSDTQQFYDEYTIPDGVTTFTIGAEIHHATLNDWR